MNNSAKTDAGSEKKTGDIEPVTGQPIEEAEKNLTHNTTKYSSPPVEEQSRTSVPLDDKGR